MTDHQQELEKLKQLYQQKFSQVEPEPSSELEMLKYSQMPSSMQQLRRRRQKPSIQKVIPVPASPLDKVGEALKTALPWLENAHALMNSSGLDKSHHELYVSVCDAMTAIQEGCGVLNDGVDE